MSRFEVAVPGLLALDGTASGNLGRHIFLESEARLRIESLEAAAALLGPRLPAAFREAGLRGRAGLSGRYTLQQTNQESTDNLSASLSLEGVELDPVVGGRPLRVRADGRIDASGPTRDPSLSIDLRSTLGRIAASGVAVAGSTVRLVASGTKASAAISRFDARLTGLDIAVTGGRTLAFDHATIAAKGGLDLSRKNLSVASLEANLPGLAPLRISGRYGFGKGGAADLRLESRGLDLPALRGLAAPFIPESFAGWDLGGTADLSLSARRPAGSRADLGPFRHGLPGRAPVQRSLVHRRRREPRSRRQARSRPLRFGSDLVHGRPRRRTGRIAVEGGLHTLDQEPARPRLRRPLRSALRRRRRAHGPGPHADDRHRRRRRVGGNGPRAFVRPADGSEPEPRTALCALFPGRRLRGGPDEGRGRARGVPPRSARTAARFRPGAGSSSPA